MKKILLLLSLILFSFADDNLNDEFDSEFTNKSLEVFDPLSGYNRLMTTFNDKAYIHVFNPIAEGYAYVVPDLARTGLDNFFHNLFFPIRFTNNLLQLKFQN
nr:VacJ family lipoprotein [Aliarcobacter sp.]